MHACRDADVIDVGLLFEIEVHAFYVFNFKVASQNEVELMR